MSYMFNSPKLANISTGDRPAARASTKYMETFQLLRPALGGTDIQTYPNAAGNLDLYTIGTANAVHRLRRGRAADAPYEDADLNISGRQLFLYTSTNEGSDTPNILSLGANGQLRLATYQSGVGSYYQVETKPKDATQTILQFKAARGVTGNIYVNVLLGDGSETSILGNNFFKPGTSEWAGPVWVPIKGPDGKDARVKALAMVENNPVQSAIFAIGADDMVWFAPSSDRTAKLRNLGAKKVTQLSVVVDSNAKLNIFAVELGTGKLLLKKEKKYSVGETQFDDWLYVDPAQTVPLRTLYASQRFDDLLQVFGIGEDGRLWRATQAHGATTSAPPVWLTLFPLGNAIPSGDGASIFAVGRDVSGYSEAYTVSGGGELTRFWQSPSSGQWSEEHVQLARGDNQMVPVQTHALELTVLNEDGLPQVDVPISIQASSLVTLFVNGKSYRASQVDRVAARTGAGGKVVIQQQANALAAATLYVETPATLAGAPLVIQPNLQLQEKLETLTVDEIKDAKDAKGNYLLPPEYRTDEYARSLQQITQASMQIAGQDENGSGKINYLAVSRRPGARRDSTRLNLAAMEGTAWEIDFTSGFPTYQALTLDQVADWKSQRLAAMNGAGMLGGFLGIDWGDAWESFKNGVKSIVDKVVKIVVEVVNGIGRVLFHIGEKVFEAIIEFAQQAFDFVQGVWNWLKVKLEQLFEWLAFLFNIEDMVRTAEAMRHSVEVILDFTVAGVQATKQTIMDGFDSMKEGLSEAVDTFVALMNEHNDPSYGNYSAEHAPTDEQLYQTEHNPFADGYDQNVEGATEKGQNLSALITQSAVAEPLEDLLKLFEDLSNNFQFGDGKQAFDEAIAYFTEIGDNPNNVVNLLLSGIVKALEGVALFALDAAKGVVGVMMDLIVEVVESFKAVLFTEWEIPIVSQLYKLFTGKTLSIRMIDIPCYIVAIPGTLSYKLITGEAPFPDQAALDAWRNLFTVDFLKSKFGISTSASYRALEVDPKTQRWVSTMCLSIYGASMIARSASDTITGLLSATGTGNPLAGLVSTTFRAVSTAMTTPWLLNLNAGAPTCGAGTANFAGWIWMCQVVFGPGRGLFLLALFKKLGDKVPAKAKIYIGEVSLTLWGVANLIMVITNYCATDAAKRNPLAFARGITNIVPGQVGRVLFTPDMQKAYFIPAGIELVLMALGYGASAGCAFSEAILMWDEDLGAAAPAALPAPA